MSIIIFIVLTEHGVFLGVEPKGGGGWAIPS